MSVKRVMIGFSGLMLAVMLSSCQAVFTFSPLASFQRNPATMTAAQQITYAQQALATGDPSTMKAAYDAIKSSTDPEVNLLAGQLAFGASGATDALTQALADVASGGSLPSINTVLQNVDITLATAGAVNIQNASSGGATVTDSQYAIASAAYIVVAAQQAGGFSQLASLTSATQPAYNNLQSAKSLVNNIQSPDLTSTIQSFY